MTEEERDTHLREALRHAPDAGMQPPAALSALILSEARAKARDAAPVAQADRSPLAAWWHWLARPAVAAGFAGVMAATLVGVMWWDQPMDEALPRRAEPAPVAAPVAPPPMVPPADTAPKPAPEAERRTQEPARAALRKEAPSADKKKAEAIAAKPAAPAPVQSAVTSVPSQPNDVTASVQAPPPAPMVSPVPAPERDRASALASASVADSAVSAESPPAARAKAGPSAAAPAMQAAAQENRATAAFDGTARKYALMPSPLTTLRSQMAREPGLWTWQRDGGIQHAMDDDMTAWLTRLDSSVGTNWTPRTTANTTAPRGRELRLLRDGRELHVMRIVGDAVLWERERSPLQAVLPSAVLDTLQSTLDTAAP